MFLEAAGFSDVQAFDVNISLSACYIIGGIICWFLFPRMGRATIYMSGMTIMFFILLAIGGLGWAKGKDSQLAIGILLVVSTLVNMITIGPACYPIVAETPSGRLRYKTIIIGRFTYNLTGIFSNSVTPRMVSPLGMCVASVLILATNVKQPGIGARRPRSSTQEPIFSATSGATSDYLRRRTERLARLICCSKTVYRQENSSILKSTVSHASSP